MPNDIITRFLELWGKYFPTGDIPIGFHYSDTDGGADPPTGVTHCFIAELGAVRRGKSVAFSILNVRCPGGRRYMGFSHELRPNFEFFLSCGIEGELEGERYKKTPELVTEHLKYQQPFVAPKRFVVFRPVDKFTSANPPEAVIFYAHADTLSGLFTLANFDSPIPEGVVAPFGSGCSSIVYYPYHENRRENPRAVLGMFDVSARPHVPSQSLTFAVPWKKFVTMVNNMDESFLTTDSWSKIARRMVLSD